MVSFRNLNLRVQLIILIVISLILMLIVQLFYYNRFEKLTQDRAEDFAATIIGQIEEKLISIDQQVRQDIFSVCYNQPVQEYMVINEPNSRKSLNNYVGEFLTFVKDSNKYIYDITIVDSQERMVTISNEYKYELVTRLKEQSSQYLSKSKDTIYSTVIKDKTDGTLYFAYISPIYSTQATTNKLFTKVGLCTFLCRADFLTGIVSNIKITPNSSFMILDQNNEIIVSNKTEMVGKVINSIDTSNTNMQKILFNNMKCIVKSKQIGSTPWKVLCAMPIDELTSDMANMRNIGIVIGVFFAVLLLLIGLVLANSITKPVKLLMAFMENLGATPNIRKNIKNRIHLPVSNEIGVISFGVNKMLDNLEEMYDRIVKTQSDLYEMELAKKQAQLSALQSQINPHFLYNTLNCISNIGLTNGINELVLITSAMSKIYRYCMLNKDYVFINDEINCIVEYMSIMNIRYMGKFIINLEIDDTLRAYKTLKMILQPIVENAMYHGLERTNRRGCLTIKGYISSAEDIFFEVKDDGIGIPTEKLKEIQKFLEKDSFSINNEINKKSSVGLKNISQRIKFAFGEKYGIRIDSEENVGTKVTLQMPLIRDEKMRENI